MDTELLKRLLLMAWSKETCSPGLRNIWNEENPALGQCAITALIVNDIYGGKIMRCMASTGSHYYNLIDGELIDLTVEQFLGEIPDYERGEERTREYLLGNADTKSRYKGLLDKVRCVLIEKDFDEIDGKESLNKYKDYLNQYYMFNDFDIDHYSCDDNFEYVRFELVAQNTGLIIEAKHNLLTDEYEYEYSETIPIPREFLQSVFEIAREYKDNIALEKQLTNAFIKL